jgi:hypothetical protein
MLRIIFFTLFFIMGYQNLMSQDTIYLKHDISKTKHNKPINFESIHFKISDELITAQNVEDSVRIDFDYKKRKVIEPYYITTQKYFFVLNKTKINESLNYLFWIRANNHKYFAFYVPGDFLLRRELMFHPYKNRRRCQFWKKKFNGFSIGHYSYLSNQLYEVNYIGETPNVLPIEVRLK